MSGSSETNPKPKVARGKRLLQNLTLSVAVFLICGGLVEVALRFAGYGSLEIYQPDPKLYWRLKPNQDCFTKVDRKAVRINSHGTRGPEFPVEKPANTMRILSLGDSRTFGWGLSEAETYSAEFGRLLQDWMTGEHRTPNVELPTSNVQHPTSNAPSAPALSPSNGARENRLRSFDETSRVEVINAGINAWSYQQMLVFYRDFAAAWKPDVVILADGNLWTQFSEQNSPRFVQQFMSRVRLKNFLRRFAIYHYLVEVKLKEFYERHRTKFIPVDPKQDTLFKEQQQEDPDAVFRAAITGVCELAITNGAKPVLLFLPRLDELQTTNVAAVLRLKREVAARLNIPLVDLTPELSAQGKELYLQADPVHLNAHGNAIVARRLFESITKQLKQ